MTAAAIQAGPPCAPTGTADAPVVATDESACAAGPPCTCPACKSGLWCKDGARGEFVRGEDDCKKCGVTAIWHSSIDPGAPPCRAVWSKR